VSRRGRGGRKLSGSGHFSQVCSGHAGVLRWALAPVCLACRGGSDVQCDGEALRQAAPCHGSIRPGKHDHPRAEAAIKKLLDEVSPGQLRMIEWDSIETAVTRVEE
jgi:hypothetical protein